MSLKSIIVATLPVICVSSSLPAFADWQGNITASSDYLFNGVSQTLNRPALQAGLTYNFSNGVYVGGWTSNVDYDEGTKRELDGYIGYFWTLSDDFSVDLMFSQYTYHGRGYSSDLNFPELSLKLAYGDWGFNSWYTWDYFGFGGDHYVFQLSRTLPLNDNWRLFAAVDTSITGDKNAWDWEGKSSFWHGQLMLQTRWQRIDIAFGYHMTTLKEKWGRDTLLLQLAYNF